jgi:hypothetical protein
MSLEWKAKETRFASINCLVSGKVTLATVSYNSLRSRENTAETYRWDSLISRANGFAKTEEKAKAACKLYVESWLLAANLRIG